MAGRPGASSLRNIFGLDTVTNQRISTGKRRFSYAIVADIKVYCQDGAFPDEGLVVDGNKLIGIAIYGGYGSPAAYNNSGGTLYELKLGD